MAEYIKTGYKRILKICPICKLEKQMRFNQKVCTGECAIEHNRQLQKAWYRAGRRKKKVVIIKPVKAEWRELTDLTEKLICIDDSRGKSAEWIGESLGHQSSK